ncbi:hypothetical protein OROMI_017273 [Orobanche minor]
MRKDGAIRSPGSLADEGGSTTIRTAETLLRVLPMPLCMSALVVMLKNSQTNDYGSLSYSDLGAFKIFSPCNASGVCAGYSLLSAVATAILRPSTMFRAWTFFLLDQLLTYIILAGGAISTEVVYLAYKGDASITWSQTCDSFGGFCRKATASIVITFIATLCFAGLSLISSDRLFSKYDAPVANTRKWIEVATFHT